VDTAQVTTTVCVILDAAGVGEWRPTGAYTTAEVGIFYGAIAAAPDRGIGVTTYMQTDDVETGLAVRMVQLWCRGTHGDPRGADVLADAAFAALHGIYHRSGLASITRKSSAPMGADGNGRQERSDNYVIVIDNPEALA